MTLTASFYEGQEVNEVIAQAKEGVEEVILNEDGSLNI